jgi:hypothetical protein
LLRFSFWECLTRIQAGQVLFFVFAGTASGVDVMLRQPEPPEIWSQVVEEPTPRSGCRRK